MLRHITKPLLAEEFEGHSSPLLPRFIIKALLYAANYALYGQIELLNSTIAVDDFRLDLLVNDLGQRGRTIAEVRELCNRVLSPLLLLGHHMLLEVCDNSLLFGEVSL